MSDSTQKSPKLKPKQAGSSSNPQCSKSLMHRALLFIKSTVSIKDLHPHKQKRNWQVWQWQLKQHRHPKCHSRAMRHSLISTTTCAQATQKNTVSISICSTFSLFYSFNTHLFHHQGNILPVYYIIIVAKCISC